MKFDKDDTVRSVTEETKKIADDCDNIKKTLDEAFVRIDAKDKALDLKLVRFRPERWGLASKAQLDDGIHSTNKNVHDKVRSMEVLVEEMRTAVNTSMK